MVCFRQRKSFSFKVAHYRDSGRFADRQQFPLTDLLVMDWRMPGMDGLELLTWLSQHPTPNMKIAVLADSSGANRDAEILANGADWFLSKKPGSAELSRAVKQMQSDLAQG